MIGSFSFLKFLYHELTRYCLCLTDDPLPKVVILGRLSLSGDRTPSSPSAQGYQTFFYFVTLVTEIPVIVLFLFRNFYNK
ncbi:hypothetical protein [Limnoraphis robusta]|uniref:hypothetical protein n=1 Tax=Limnoraphis robusta TaxID=1118279 RepID=UPI00128ED6FF|nr:hypothetical protein [Limnoraphis robusta]